MRCSEYIRSNPTATKEDVVSNVGCHPDTATKALKKFRNHGAIIISGPVPAELYEGERIAFVYTPDKYVVELLEKTE